MSSGVLPVFEGYDEIPAYPTSFAPPALDDKTRLEEHLKLESPPLPHWDLVRAANAGTAASTEMSTNQGFTKLPLKSFNHVSREVLSLPLSIQFYCNVLGFVEIKRPEFEADGVWLWGYGISFHLIGTRVPDRRQAVKGNRIQHFTSQLPTVDHIAFLTDDLPAIVRVLEEAHVYHKRASLVQSGIDQVFFFDPDGNVIEISNCAPPIDEDSCYSASSSITATVTIPP